MNYCKKRARFEASNVYFDDKNKIAVSYNWWVFVKEINGLIVFNWYKYSRSTIKHQDKVDWLLRELNITVDRTVSFRESLERCHSLKDLKEAQKRQDEMNKINDERKRVERNKRAKERRQKAKELLKTDKKPMGLMVINGGLQ
jgi:hypothetical protein